MKTAKNYNKEETLTFEEHIKDLGLDKSEAEPTFTNNKFENKRHCLGYKRKNYLIIVMKLRNENIILFVRKIKR